MKQVSFTAWIVGVSLGLGMGTPLSAQHEHHHGAAAPVRKPRIFLDKSPRIVAYQLKRLTNEELLLVDRGADDAKYLPVHREILLREGMSPNHRQQALAAMQAINQTSAADQLLGVAGALDLDDASQRVVFGQLAAMLLRSPKLRQSAEQLRAAARSDQPGQRTLGLAGLIEIGGNDDAWSLAADEAPRRDYLRAVTLAPSAARRAASRPNVGQCLSPQQPLAIRRAALQALPALPDGTRSFAEIAPFVRQSPLRAAAVRALLRIPQQQWPRALAAELLEELVSHVEQLPPAKRTSDAELDGLELADQLLALAPAAAGRAYRQRLQAVAVRVVRVRTVHEEMRYDTAYFAVEAGRPVELVLTNDDAMPHNLVITRPGQLRAVAEAAAALDNTPGRDGMLYVPDIPDVLHATGLVPADGQHRLVFEAPQEPGEYPFVCTFPRHWMRMYGVMVVVADLDAWRADPHPPADPLGNLRSLVKQWTPDDFPAPQLAVSLQARSPEIGAKLFAEATCAQCHRIGGQGGAVGPPLNGVADRWKGDAAGVLREMLDPSYKVDPQFAVHAIRTDSGRALSGIITAQDRDTITLVSNPDSPRPTVIARDEIVRMVKTSTSMMPKGLLDRYTADEIFEILSFVLAQPVLK